MYCGGNEARIGPYHLGRVMKVIEPGRGSVDFFPYTCRHCLQSACEVTGLADKYRQDGAESAPAPPTQEPEAPFPQSYVDELAAAVVKQIEIHRFEEIAAGIELPDEAPKPSTRRKPKGQQ